MILNNLQHGTTAKMAETTRSMRKSVIDRDIAPVFENRLLHEITADDLRAQCEKVKERGAPAVHVRDIVKQVYVFAILHGEKIANPTDDVGAASIATFAPKDRALSPTEIRLMYRQMESVATYPTIRLALCMILLTLVRKSELIQATWDEVNFEAALWTIPKGRMKAAICTMCLSVAVGARHHGSASYLRWWFKVRVAVAL